MGKSLLSVKRKKKPRVKTIEAADLLKMYGSTPIYNGKGLDDPGYKSDLIRALNWCNRGLDYKEIRKELVAWMELNSYSKADVRAVKANQEHYGIVDGKMAYLINNNWPLSDEQLNRMTERVSILINDGNRIIKSRKKDTKEKEATDTLKKENKESPDAINFRESQEIYDEIQDNVFLTVKMDMARVTALVKGKKAVVLNKTIEMLKELSEEISLFGKDDQITEAYDYLTAAKVKKIVKLLNDSIGVIEGEAINKRTIRKPRAAKVKSAAVQVKSFKHKKSDKTYNLESIEPINIIGKSKMVIFNTKYRKLGIYYAADANGFSVKGTTVQNFDTEISEQKTLRDTKSKKISDWLLEFRKAPVKKVDKVFGSVTTTNTKLTGRFNEDTIILKVYK